jgi:hypothetical protein
MAPLLVPGYTLVHHANDPKPLSRFAASSSQSDRSRGLGPPIDTLRICATPECVITPHREVVRLNDLYFLEGSYCGFCNHPIDDRRVPYGLGRTHDYSGFCVGGECPPQLGGEWAPIARSVGMFGRPDRCWRE